MTGTTLQTTQGNLETLISEAREKIFGELVLQNDKNNLLELCFMRHYFLWEIGTETPAQFIMCVRDKFHLIKDKYERLLYSADLSYNPLEDENYSIHHIGKYNSKSHAENSNEGNTFNLFSDTPQGTLSGVEDGNYLSAATHVSNKDGSKGDNSGSGNDEYTDTHKGKTTGFSYAKSIADYRNNIIQIEKMFVDEFKDCFMLVW